MAPQAIPSDKDSRADSAGLRERKRARTRRAIIDAAWVLFTRDGEAATSMHAIAELAEVSDVTMYNYVNSRAQLIEEMFSRDGSMERAVTALAELAEDVPPIEALRALNRAQLEISGAEFRRQRKMLRLINGEPVLRGAYRNAQSGYLEILVDALLPRATRIGMSQQDLHLLCLAYSGMIDGISESRQALSSARAWVDAADHALDLLAAGWAR